MQPDFDTRETGGHGGPPLQLLLAGLNQLSGRPSVAARRLNHG